MFKLTQYKLDILTVLQRLYSRETKLYATYLFNFSFLNSLMETEYTDVLFTSSLLWLHQASGSLYAHQEATCKVHTELMLIIFSVIWTWEGGERINLYNAFYYSMFYFL